MIKFFKKWQTFEKINCATLCFYPFKMDEKSELPYIIWKKTVNFMWMNGSRFENKTHPLSLPGITIPEMGEVVLSFASEIQWLVLLKLLQTIFPISLLLMERRRSLNLSASPTVWYSFYVNVSSLTLQKAVSLCGCFYVFRQLWAHSFLHRHNVHHAVWYSSAYERHIIVNPKSTRWEGRNWRTTSPALFQQYPVSYFS